MFGSIRSVPRRAPHLLPALGALAWGILFAAERFPSIAQALVALAVVAIVPLGVRVAADESTRAQRVCAALPVASALGLASFFFAPSALAGALAAGWLVGTLAIAYLGAARIARRGLGPIEELSIDLGHLYLPVGAVWMCASRAGRPLLGFEEPVVLYTAAHFHYAGFAAPVVIGLLGRELALRRAPSTPDVAIASLSLRRGYTLSASVTLLGIPLVAAGITLSHALELPSALLLGAAMLLNMLWLIRAGAARLRKRQGEGALLISAGVALLLSMGLVFLFATTGSATRGSAAPLIPYSTMAALHGSANAIFFAGLSLVAFARRPPPRRHDPLGGSWPRLLARSYIGADFFERVGARAPGEAPLGQVDTIDVFAHAGFDPQRVHRDVRTFYEQTSRFDLRVSPTWHHPFQLGGRLFVAFAARYLGQLVLPIRDDGDERVTTRVFCLHPEYDARDGARGYVRAYGEEGARPNFVAAYARHAAPTRTLLSAAFPLPFAALVAVLRFDDGAHEGGLLVTSAPRADEGPGDEGMFLLTPFGPLRLPLEERIEVWVDEAGALRAEHSTRLFGLICFRLHYRLVRGAALSDS